MHFRATVGIFIILVASSVFSVSNGADTPKTKKVLLIHGDGNVGFWEQEFGSALYSKVSISENIHLYPEFLTINQQSEILIDDYLDSITTRYRGIKFDMIIAVQPTACDFVLKWGSAFGESIPKLLVLPNPNSRDEIKKQNNITVINSAWSAALTKTIASMLVISPELERLYVVSGDGLADRSYLKRSKVVIDRYTKGLNIRYLIGEQPNDMLATFAAADVPSAVLMLTYNYTKDNNSVRSRDVTLPLMKKSNLPIYAPHDASFGSGLVGGNQTSPASYGRHTAVVLLDLLHNRPLTKDTELSSYGFDLEAMEKWDLDASKLPPNSHLINDNPPFWKIYAKELLIALFILLLQTALIISQQRSLRAKRLAERERDKQIEQRENQTHLFEAVINGINEAVVITDNEHQVIATNQQGFINTFGYAPKEILNRPMDKLLHKVQSSSADEATLTSLSVEPQIFEYQNAEQKVFHGETVGAKITNASGQTVGQFALIRDITERLNSEEVQQQGNKMEALGNLAGGIAHDFNNMLMAIMGNAELASLHLDDRNEVEESLTRIQRVSVRAKNLVEQILTFSRRSEGNELSAININTLLAEIQQLLKASIPATITLDLSWDEKLSPIKANENQIHQVIMNLCTNSQYAMPSGGCLKIQATNCHLDEDLKLSKATVPAGNYVVLSVSDTGSGIPAEVLSRIFEPFYTTKPRGEGTGMGMALVYGIVKSHQAYIDLTSELSQGTQIRIFFSAVDANGKIETIKKKTNISLGDGEVILVVDDEPEVLLACQRSLNLLGYKVDAYDSANEALIALSQSPDKYDLVITDQTMPEITGIELLRKVLAIRPDLPTILCTGYTEEHMHDTLALSNRSVLLGKPYSIRELAALTNQALQPHTSQLSTI